MGWEKNNQSETKMKNKKALSTIIATTVIILISLVAITMLWFSVKKLTERVTMSPEISCFDIKIAPPVTIKSACYNSETQKIQTELKRNLEDIKINSMYILSDANEWGCGIKCSQCIILKQGETKKYFFDSEQNPGKITLKIENCIIETKNIISCIN